MILDEHELALDLTNVEKRMKRIIDSFLIKDHLGESISIECNPIPPDSEKTQTGVDRKSPDSPNQYEIKIDVSLIRMLIESAEKTVNTPSHEIPTSHKEFVVNSGEIKKNRNSAIYTAFWLSVEFVTLHEVAHVILGHVDRYYATNKAFSHEHRKACEADADRWAGQRLAESFTRSLEKNNNSYEKLSFSSKFCAHEFYVYNFISFFDIFCDKEDEICYPLENVRFLTVFSALSLHLQEKHPLSDHENIILNLYISRLNAEKQLPTNKLEYLNIIRKLFLLDLNEFMSYDNQIIDTKIDEYAHTFEKREC
jgi:hypothetical protein